MCAFALNEIVKIKKKISKKSYYLYKDYKSKSSLIVCPCTLKEKSVKIRMFLGDNDNMALCVYKDRVFTIIYTEDLEKITN
jgi:hypothetical protein